MSIDPATVKLIETSDAIRAKYAGQARSVSLQLLIDALDIINKCDVTYRTSNNKRLALEVPMIQICRLSGQMEMPAVSPVAIIKEVPVSDSQSATPVQVVAEPVAPVAPPAPVPVVIAPPPVEAATPVVEVEKPSSPVIDVVPPIQPVKEAEPETVSAPEHDVPVQSHHTSSISIKSVTKADQLASSVKAEVVLDRTGAYTFEQMEEALLRFAELKKADSAMFYSALTSYKTILQPDNVILITVGNTVLEKELNERRNLLLEFLRNELKNDFITMQVTVTEQPLETNKYMNDSDKLNAMALQNPNVNKLRDQLNLELDL
jgi:DNA polymerase-3 subunit gamma/tau